MQVSPTAVMLSFSAYDNLYELIINEGTVISVVAILNHHHQYCCYLCYSNITYIYFLKTWPFIFYQIFYSLYSEFIIFYFISLIRKIKDWREGHSKSDRIDILESII